MSDVTDAIERFEAAGASGVGLDEAEAALHALLAGVLNPAANHDDVCLPFAEGCTEGLTYRGTVYAAGFNEAGRPVVVVMRRVWSVQEWEALRLVSPDPGGPFSAISAGYRPGNN